MSTTLSRSDEIAEVLRTEILRGQYRPGERLPSERDLAARFGTNRGAIREAIKKLEQLGIVDVTPGGVRVLPVENASLEVLGHLLDLDEAASPELFDQIFDVLGAMMALSARSAIQAADREATRRMAEIITRLIDLAPGYGQKDAREAGYAAWSELGECFLYTNNNLVLRLLFNGIRTQFIGRIGALGLRPKIDVEADVSQLEQLQAAVNEGKAAAAADAILNHFALIKTAVLTAMPSRASSSESVRRAGND